MGDSVNHPEHYNLPGLGIEAIDVIRSALGPDGFANYCQGNVIKYVIRAGKKGDKAEDLRKAEKYLAWEIETLGSSDGGGRENHEQGASVRPDLPDLWEGI